MQKILSGPVWVNKFPNSTSIGDLVEPFQTNVTKFVGALRAAKASVTISATLRPKERAYLMHWSFLVAKENLDPEKVDAMNGVDIEWVHTDAKGNKDLSASKNAALQMVNLYDIAFRPALTSRHIEGKAIDMDISWSSKDLTMKDAAGKDVTISSNPKSGGNTDLQAVGKSYGVIKLVSDPPHWSTDGH
jgi:hypothetical protein